MKRKKKDKEKNKRERRKRKKKKERGKRIPAHCQNRQVKTVLHRMNLREGFEYCLNAQ